ncbi:MAG: glycosyltransferase family 2 protein, partial [Segetibacter sp.]
MVSAVILAYNRCSEVLFTIGKLKEFRKTLPFDLEIVVVDNASVDSTSQAIKEMHPDITLVTNPKNNGIAGWNEGFKAANNKYFLVLDDDSHIHSGLKKAVIYLEQNKDIGILALNIKDALLRAHNLPEDIAWKDKQDIEGFIGCGAIIRKEVYDKIGGFAEWIYVYTHEFEYAIRCLNEGYKVQFFQDGVVSHRASSVNRTNKRLRLFGTRNEMAIVYKYFIKHRWKYIWRVWVNNMKNMKSEGLASGSNVLLGGIEFFKLSKQLVHTPVSIDVQNYF